MAAILVPSWIFVLEPGLCNLRNGVLATTNKILYTGNVSVCDKVNCNKTPLSLGLYCLKQYFAFPEKNSSPKLTLKTF
jgi:hypothetical protein